MRSSRHSTLVLAAAALLTGSALAIALIGRAGPDTLAERVDAVAATLRCPVCQNLSVADSTSGVAGEMRRSIAEQLRSGRSPDQIRARFVAAYGEWILLSPPVRGAGLLAWAVPAVVVLAAAGAAAMTLRRWTIRRAPE